MVDREELVRRATELVPVLRQRASLTEGLRRLPKETIDALHAAEFMRAPQPKRFGGFDLDYDVLFDVGAELGRGCGSTAWCFCIWASHNWVAGMFPEQAQQEYWAASVDTLSSTGLNPAGAQVTVVEGGYRLSGHWDFSSGCDDSTWALVAGIGPEGMLYFLVPRADYVIEDTWFVSGLRGTGSKDITMDNVFVPQHRALLQAHMKEGQTPGRDLHGTPNFRIPHLTVFAYTLAAPIVGMAQGALDAFEAHMRDRVDITTGETMAEFGTVQIRLAESAAEIDAARTIMQQDGREVFARARRDELPTLDDRARYRRNQGYVVKLSVQAVERLFQASGGHTIFDSSPVQRFHRDAHAASHHIAISWDILAEQYGRVRLGLEPKSTSNL